MLTWNTTIVNGFSDSSTVHLGPRRANTELATIKLLLVDILSNRATDSVVGNKKNRVVLPSICEVHSHLGVSVTCPEPQDSPAQPTSKVVTTGSIWSSVGVFYLSEISDVPAGSGKGCKT